MQVNIKVNHREGLKQKSKQVEIKGSKTEKRENTFGPQGAN
jgi:hypothetical protein